VPINTAGCGLEPSPGACLYGIDEDTAEYYAQIVSDLRKNGIPIPTNDIWIAAVAFQHRFRLFTKDRHFQAVPGLLMTVF
jgi:tRNA(fMet)-specific endonuclease VapC